MANAWQVRFQPTILALKADGKGNFSSVQIQPGASTRPPAGSFPVVISVTPRLTETNKGPAPIKPGDNVPAILELLGRAQPQIATQAPPFVSLGILNGKIDFNTSSTLPKPLPRFTAGTKRSGNNSLLDFTPSSLAEVDRSDWVLKIEKDADTFDTNVVSSFFVNLPWQFVENPGKMQLSARLSTGGSVIADEVRNTPLDLPLRHTQVPADAKPGSPLLTFFGLRNLYTKSNADSVPRVPIGNGKLRLILHDTFTDFCTKKTATVSDVSDGLSKIMTDAGFPTIQVLTGPPAVTECDLHWKRVGGHFMGKKILDPDTSKAAEDPSRLENKVSQAISSNTIGSLTIPKGMEEVVPFFDFYIFAEDAEPPSPTELAHSETAILSLTSPTAVTKALFTPIVIAKGTSSLSPLPALLDKIAQADRSKVLATTVCHEIGHSFGLRHSVAFIDLPPYVESDPTFSRGTMGSAGLNIGLGTPRIPLGFFGPVHVAEIRRMFL